MLANDDLIGKIIDGRYEILSVLGHGGMGAVYKARHLELEKLVAIKILLSIQPTAQKRFQREASIISSLDHPNIVKVDRMSISPGDGKLFLVMDYLEGETLAQLLFRQVCLPVDRAMSIFDQICQAMQCAADKGIVHRDLKPSNVMLVQEEGKIVVKLLDFGLAKIYGGAMQSLTSTESLLGSPHYMSPEQCQALELDARSDIYSMGILMYETLTGKLPFQAESPHMVLSMQLEEEAKPPSTHGIAIPAFLDNIVIKCLNKDPASRFQSWNSLKDALRNRVQVTTKLSATKRRKRKAVTALVLAVLTAICACFIFRPLSQRTIVEPTTLAQVKNNMEAAKTAPPDQALSLLRQNEKFLLKAIQKAQIGRQDSPERSKRALRDAQSLELMGDCIAARLKLQPDKDEALSAVRYYAEATEVYGYRVVAGHAVRCMRKQLEILKKLQPLVAESFLRIIGKQAYFAVTSGEPEAKQMCLECLGFVDGTSKLGKPDPETTMNLLIGLSRISWSRGDRLQANQYLSRAMALKSVGDPGQRYELALQSLYQYRPAQAAKIASEAINTSYDRFNPGLYGPYQCLSLAALEAEQIDLAKQCFQTCCRITYMEDSPLQRELPFCCLIESRMQSKDQASALKLAEYQVRFAQTLTENRTRFLMDSHLKKFDVLYRSATENAIAKNFLLAKKQIDEAKNECRVIEQLARTLEQPKYLAMSFLYLSQTLDPGDLRSRVACLDTAIKLWPKDENLPPLSSAKEIDVLLLRVRILIQTGYNDTTRTALINLLKRDPCDCTAAFRSYGLQAFLNGSLLAAEKDPSLSVLFAQKALTYVQVMEPIDPVLVKLCYERLHEQYTKMGDSAQAAAIEAQMKAPPS